MNYDLDAAAPDTGDGYGGGFGIAATALATISTRAAEKCRGGAQGGRERLFQRMHQIPLGLVSVPITAGAGAFQMNDLLMPKAGYMWSVRRLTASGFTAGTVQVFKNGFVLGGAAVGGELVLPFAAAGTQTLGRGELLLDEGDALVISATGITGTLQLQGAADCFERWLLPDYLM